MAAPPIGGEADHAVGFADAGMVGTDPPLALIQRRVEKDNPCLEFRGPEDAFGLCGSGDYEPGAFMRGVGRKGCK